MNFNNTWRNYINRPTKSKGRLLGEQIIREYKLIAEGKKDDAKKIAPIASSFGTIDTMANQLRMLFGDKGVGKYIVFCARECEVAYEKTYYKNDRGTYSYRPEAGFVSITRVFEEILGAVRQFHTVQNRLEQKDINKYTLRSLRRTLDNLPESETARKKAFRDKAEAERNSELIYLANGIHAVRPLTTQASCFFGHNPRLTTWCISTKSKNNYFKKYTEEEGKAFVMVRFFGIPEKTDNHIITLQWSGPGEPEFEMWWDGPRNRAQNPDDLMDVFREHVDGLYVHRRGGKEYSVDYKITLTAEEREDLARELHDAVVGASKDAVFDNPPDDPIDAITPKCEAIEDAFDEKSEHTSLWWEADQDTFQEDGYVAVYYGADTKFQLEPEDYNIPAEVIDDPKLDFSFWRQVEKKWEEACKKGGLYVFENYHLSRVAGNAAYIDVPGAITLKMKHEADTTIGGYTLEGFEEFARDALEIEQEDAMQTRKLAIAILQDQFNVTNTEPSEPSKKGDQQTGLPPEDEVGFSDEIGENMFYKELEKQLLGEEKGRSRQRGIYKFHCMISYNLTAEQDKARGLDDILADMRALPNVTIVTVAIRNQKVAEGRYIAGLAIKFIPSIPGDMNQPEQTKARIVRDIKRLSNVQSLFKLSAGLIRLE